MAAAPERNEKKLHEDGGGFGKFRKRPFGRSQATPYDRPPTAIRSSGNGGSIVGNGSGNGGWLSKLVDPAHRLIASSAHKLFSSVFRKRLLPPPPPEPVEANREAADEQQETVFSESPGSPVPAVNNYEVPGGSSERDEVAELELILKQKTFTRSEIDRLTALLQSRTVDIHVRDEEKISEATPSKEELSQDRKEKFPNSPVIFNEIEGCFISTPAVSSSVLVEDVASPAELAKAYMGSRSSKVSPSMLGLRSQPLRKESAALMNQPFPLTSPIMSVVPKSSGHNSVRGNSFVTPRSRGRSAIYSMARPPYSRVHLTPALQGYGTTIDSFGGPSTSSKNAWNGDNNRISGSKLGDLKRRSSVLDNDIGSAGPIRRIRQKANLLPASGTISIRGTGFGSDSTAQHPSLRKNLVLVDESSKENGDNSLHGSGFTSVPSKSREMASKILQQLDVLVSSREKSPAKLSPSMLRGPALSSLDNVDSSKLLENVQDNNRSDVKHDISLPDTRNSVFQKQDKIEENGTTRAVINSVVKPDSAVNLVNTTSLLQNNASNVKTTAVINSVVKPSSQKSWTLQTSAHEDYVELDDDDYSNGTKSATSVLMKEEPDKTLSKDKKSVTEVITVEKRATFSEINHTEGSMMNQKALGISNVSVVAEKSTGFTFPNSTLSGATVLQQAVANNLSTVKCDEATEPKKLNAAPMFNFGEKLVLPKEPNGASPTSDFGCKTAEKISQFTWASSKLPVSDSTDTKLTAFSNHKLENSSSIASVATGAIVAMTKQLEADRVDDKNCLKDGVFLRSSETVSLPVSTSAPTSISSFGSQAISLPLSNGSLLSAPSSFSSPSPLVSNNVPIQNSSGSNINAVADSSATPNTATTTYATSSSSIFSITASTPSIMTSPIFNFGSSVPPTSSLSVRAAVWGEPAEAETKETITGKVSTAPNLGTTFAGTNTGSSLFSGLSAVTGTGGSAFTSTGSNIFNLIPTSAATCHSQGFDSSSSPASVQAPAAGTGFGASPSSSFGLPGSTIFPSGGSLFSSSTAKPFSSTVTFGLTSSTSSSDANAISSINTNTITPMLSSSRQTPKASMFGSTFSSSSSPGFTFGLSSVSNTATSSTPMVFGSSANSFGALSTSNTAVTSSTTMALGSSTTASSSPIFPFSSPAVSTPVQPVFGNSNPSFAFGASVSPGNNDQMNVEDSMAEDTVQATTPTVPVFNQPLNVPSSSGFVFGATVQSGENPFSATSTSGVNFFSATSASGANQFGATSTSEVNRFGATSTSGANPFGATVSSGGNSFQFASQPNMAAPLTSSPFQASGSSFSLGSGGGDKSGRKFIKVRKSQRKK